MTVMLALLGDQPLDLPCLDLRGYHRPLGGEVANLTVTVSHAEFPTGWLEAPPLGQGCHLTDGAVSLLLGVLYSVRITSETIELGIEG